MISLFSSLRSKITARELRVNGVIELIREFRRVITETDDSG